MKRALISVSDKTGIVAFAKKLSALGVEIISTGGTHKALEAAGLNVIGISDVTGFPECLDGRVKTLHPSIHAGILAIRGNQEHMAQLENLGIDTIDFVIVNLYPFKQTVLKEGVSRAEAIENIDIGGPTMIRAAAKNYQDVAVIIDPKDYDRIIEEEKQGGVTADTKFYLATKVFMHTAHYDSLIASYLKKEAGIEQFPETITLTYEKAQDMRYGENPHQNAAFYKEIGANEGMLTNAVQLHGKELSFNNINDTHGALELLKEFGQEPTIVACKHSNPCGVASASTVHEAYLKAYNSDPVSIFGGIVVSNTEIDKATAEEINKIFLEIVLAPSFSQDALELLKQKKNIRLLTLKDIERKQPAGALDMKKVSGGLLVQDIDAVLLPEQAPKTVTKRAPSEKEMEDLLFAWKIVKYTKSNGIAIGKEKQSIGIGPGQVNRIWACKQAIEHGLDHLGVEAVKGSVLASDAFFPFPDCVDECAKAGITAIIQPGGSIHDADSIAACDKAGIAMVFTSMRHFRH